MTYRVGYFDGTNNFHLLDKGGGDWKTVDAAQRVAKDDYICEALCGRLLPSTDHRLVVVYAGTHQVVCHYNPRENEWEVG